jgi:cell division septal protein FtsQ
MLISAGAVYGLASTSAFGFERLQIDGATITPEADIRSTLDLTTGVNLFQVTTDPLEARLLAIPAIARADVSIGLPGTVSVRVAERVPLLIWQVGSHRFLVDEAGLLFAETTAKPPAALGPLQTVADSRAASKAFKTGSTVDPVDLDVARRLVSLTPSDVGSAASGLRVTVSDQNGFAIHSIPSSWAAIFGFYGRSLRTPELVPGQVQLLGRLLARAGEPTVDMVILADDRDGTYIPKATPVPSPTPKP